MTMPLNPNHSQLILVDFQPRLMTAINNADFALGNARRLAQAAKMLAVPACTTEQNPSKLGPGDATLTSEVQETFAKMCFGGAGPELCTWLRLGSPTGQNVDAKTGTEETPTPARNSIVIAGCETHICLLQTAMQLKALGLSVYVVADACGSRTGQNHEMAISRLAAAGCHIVTTEMVLFEWLATAEHPQFKMVQALIK